MEIHNNRGHQIGRWLLPIRSANHRRTENIFADDRLPIRGKTKFSGLFGGELQPKGLIDYEYGKKNKAEISG